jgi:sugar (pentulose or hexulose) kinase
MGAAGLQPTELVCVAGGARAALLLQIRADVTGLPVTRPDDVETTARGAGMLAAAGVGMHPHARAAAKEMRSPRREAVQPDAERANAYTSAYDRYRQLYNALRPLF